MIIYDKIKCMKLIGYRYVPAEDEKNYFTNNNINVLSKAYFIKNNLYNNTHNVYLNDTFTLKTFNEIVQEAPLMLDVWQDLMEYLEIVCQKFDRDLFEFFIGLENNSIEKVLDNLVKEVNKMLIETNIKYENG